MKLENHVNDLINKELGKIDKSPFSTNGFDSYIKNVTSYTIQLFTLSKFFAKSQGTEFITEGVVKKAAEKIHKSSNEKVLNLILSFAGLLLGSAISHMVTLSMNSTLINTNNMIFIMGTGLTGAFLFGFYLFK
ncbi:hypothetical protein WJR50_23580 [Catalinimonas sp. 4WD22]|uniref:hypothetical protein n=1 Tax=Catalinimonas locisalis TaxID=3133978 RepID=UPI0031012AA6